VVIVSAKPVNYPQKGSLLLVFIISSYSLGTQNAVIATSPRVKGGGIYGERGVKGEEFTETRGRNLRVMWIENRRFVEEKIRFSTNNREI